MKYFILGLAVFSTAACADVDTVTDKFDTFNKAWDNCSSAKECGELSFEFNAYINHPNVQQDLIACEKQAKCYESMMSLTMKMMTQLHKITG